VGTKPSSSVLGGAHGGDVVMNNDDADGGVEGLGGSWADLVLLEEIAVVNSFLDLLIRAFVE